MIIGITGSIACGKSTVTNYLLENDYMVIDADKIAHDVLFDSKIQSEIKNIFSEIVFSDGEINRKKLGEIVFKDKNKLLQLNNITHPRIKEVIREKISSLKGIIFVDIPLLFEAKFADLVDKVIVVHADYGNQLKRLMERNNFSKEEAINRINKQLSSEYKKNLADYVIDNNGTVEETINQVDEILRIIKGETYGTKN